MSDHGKPKEYSEVLHEHTREYNNGKRHSPNLDNKDS